MKQSNVVVEYDEILGKASEASGIPKKQLKVDSDAITEAVLSTMSERQPKRDGDTAQIYTPLIGYSMAVEPATVIKDRDGRDIEVPRHISIRTSVPNNIISAANAGYIDDATAEAVGGKIKKADTKTA